MQRMPSGALDGWQDFVTSSPTHLTAITGAYYRYIQEDSTVRFALYVGGTGDGSASGQSPTFLLPVLAAANFYTQTFCGVTDNGVYSYSSAGIGDSDNAHVTIYKTYSGNGLGYEFWMEGTYEALVGF